MTEKKYLNMNLMAVCGTVYRRASDEASSSGSDVALEQQLDDFSQHVGQISAVSLEKTGLPQVEKIAKNITVYRVADELIPQAMRTVHDLLHKGRTDAVIAQVMHMDVALKTAKDLQIKTIFNQHDFDVLPSMGKGGEIEPTLFLAPSRAVAERIAEVAGKEAIIYPNRFANLHEIIGSDTIQQKYDVLMFNPNTLKGGNIFVELAKRFPELQFAAVEGWTDLKTGGVFDLPLMQIMARSYSGDATAVQIPEEPSFTDIKNLTVLQPQKRVGDLIKAARLVLAPSQWEEAFGRVIVDAGLNNRHIIASNIGGIPEAMTVAGMPIETHPQLLVDDYTNIEAWITALRFFLQNETKLPKPEPKLPTPNITAVLDYLVNN